MMLQALMENALVERLGWVLLHFLWQGALVALVLGVVLWVLRGGRAQVRYMVGLGAMGLVVLMPAGTFVWLSLGVAGGAGETSGVAARVPVESGLPGRSEGSGGVGPVAVKEFALGSGEKVAAVRQRGDLMPPRVTQATVSAVPAAVSWRDVIVEKTSVAAPYLVPCWLVGVLGLSLWNVAAWAALQRMKVRLTRDAGARLQRLADGIAGRLSIRFPVRLLECAAIDSPMVMGFFKPAVLLPVSLATGLPAGQIEALLAHELAHIRRHDYVVNLLQTMVETLLFYHPAVWWISRRIRIEREHCCDDLALSITSDRKAYVQALAAVADVRSPGLVPGANTGGRGVLLPRLTRILGMPTRDAVRPSRFAAGILALALLLAAAITTAVQTAAVARAAEEDIPSKYPPVGRIDPSITYPVADHMVREGKCELAGTVVDAEGKPVKDAKVHLCNDLLKSSYVREKDVTWNQNQWTLATVSTDENGKFRFNYLMPGRTDLWAETATHAGIERYLDSSDKQVSITVAPKKETITVRGHLFDIDGKTPLAGVPMLLMNGESDAKLLAETKTTEGGKYSFEIKPVYSYSPCLYVIARPEERAMAWATLPICSVNGFDLQLKPVSRLTGRIVAKNGQTLEGATVRVVRLQDPQFGLISWHGEKQAANPEVKTDKDGWYTITDIPQGADADMVVLHPEYQRMQMEVKALQIEEEVADTRLPEGAVIEGTIYLGAKDKVAPGAKVTLGYPMSPEKTVTADENGHYRAGGIADMGGRPSQQSITAEWGGAPPQWEGLVYHEEARQSGEHFTIDVTLHPSLSSRQASWNAAPGTPATSNAHLALLADEDPALGGKTQYDDVLNVLDSSGKRLWQVPHLSICQTSGGAHPLAADGERGALWVVEVVGNRLMKFDRDGHLAWEKPDIHANSMAIDPITGNAWMLTSKGTIYGENTLVVSPAGEKVQEIKAGGYDIAYSHHDDCFWIVGKSLQRVDRSGKVTDTPAQFPWVAVAVSVNDADGSVWVAEGRHPNVIDSRGQVYIFSADGTLRKKFEVFPDVRSIAVDGARGIGWICGRGGVLKVDADGKTLAEAPIQMAMSCAIEPDTGYAWFASIKGGLYRVDRDARPVWSDTSSSCQKTIAVFP